MKYISILIICVLFSCNETKNQENKAKIILGKWELTTNKQHGWVVTPDSMSYSDRKDRSTYTVFADSLNVMNDHFRSNDNYKLTFTGNDTLTLNGTDGEHIYVRVK